MTGNSFDILYYINYFIVRLNDVTMIMDIDRHKERMTEDQMILEQLRMTADEHSLIAVEHSKGSKLKHQIGYE